jgi:hypothetical protein
MHSHIKPISAAAVQKSPEAMQWSKATLDFHSKIVSENSDIVKLSTA